MESAPNVLSTPTACPFCQSSNITTTSVKVDESSYWRCKACGDIWNRARCQAAANYNYYHPRWK